MHTSTSHNRLLLVLLVLVEPCTHTLAWLPSQPLTHCQQYTATRTGSFALYAAKGKSGGFGGGVKANTAPLKPKQQWDRYLIDLKGQPKIKVAVQVKSTASTTTTTSADASENDSSNDTTTTTANNNEWLEVGMVRCRSDVSPAIAVARQRKLIAEVSYPCCSMQQQ
jgi:hypothetical protein